MKIWFLNHPLRSFENLLKLVYSFNLFLKLVSSFFFETRAHEAGPILIEKNYNKAKNVEAKLCQTDN